MQVLYDPIKTIKRIRHIMNELEDQDLYEECSQLYFEAHTKAICNEEAMCWSETAYDVEGLEAVLSRFLKMSECEPKADDHDERVNAQRFIDSLWYAYSIDKDGALADSIVRLASAIDERRGKEND